MFDVDTDLKFIRGDNRIRDDVLEKRFGAQLITSRIADVRKMPLIDERVLDELRSLGGYPIETITSIKMGTIDDRIEQTVLKMEMVNVGAGFYAVPSGYTEAQPTQQR